MNDPKWEGVTLRCTVDHLRSSMIHQIALHEREIDREVADAVNRAFASFDFGAEISANIPSYFREVIDRKIRDFFRDGEGREMVEKAFAEALKRVVDQRSEWFGDIK